MLMLAYARRSYSKKKNTTYGFEILPFYEGFVKLGFNFIDEKMDAAAKKDATSSTITAKEATDAVKNVVAEASLLLRGSHIISQAR
jgi:hypothetical protein